eukprot:GHUV01039588.1.p2 GENE.GHUV01039588.1~~GHUV01039588.1.p2  ORF type:complete len:116 (-),score=36.43 GHUV01039588.1:44-391(-)
MLLLLLQVLPELQDPNVNERPILKADALKFVTTFRSQLPTATLVALLPPCIALLGSEHVVVHSYAATAIERFLALREGGKFRWVLWTVLGCLLWAEGVHQAACYSKRICLSACSD